MTTAADFFQENARRYDSMALRAMPRYEEMLGEVLRCIPADATDILELGCGTGALTALLAGNHPDATLTAVDAAPEMVAIARERVNAVAAGREVEFVVGLFEELTLAQGAYDVIASNMSLHHIQEKGPFYHRLKAAVRPGGLFVLGDELKAEHAVIERMNWDSWREFAGQPGHLTEEEVADIIRHDEEFDHYETLPRQLELLAEAGFQSGDCVWRYLNYSVFVAQA